MCHTNASLNITAITVLQNKHHHCRKTWICLLRETPPYHQSRQRQIQGLLAVVTATRIQK
jgi:hypothetical protein